MIEQKQTYLCLPKGVGRSRSKCVRSIAFAVFFSKREEIVEKERERSGIKKKKILFSFALLNNSFVTDCVRGSFSKMILKT